jgi:hypothetical protein
MPSKNRGGAKLKYTLVACIFALTSIFLLEQAGTQLTRSYSGLDGKLSVHSPAAATVPSNCKQPPAVASKVCE